MGTDSPAPLRAWANPATIRSGGEAVSGPPLQRRPDEIADAGGPDPVLVLLVLEHRPQREVDGALVDVAPAQRGQGGRPVDRLGHPGRLVEVHAAQLLDG